MHILSNVAASPALPAAQAVYHFESRLRKEADCADVGADIAAGVAEFVLVDCRSSALYEREHLPGAINIPHRRITEALVDELVPDHDRMIVTYCNGPHCNASTKGALRFAELGRPVKEMVGGMVGWREEGLPVERGAAPGR